MLHDVLKSRKRFRLLKVVVLQRKLLAALCELPVGSSVDQSWLESLWAGLPQDWVRRFWQNDKGNRATWIATIAAASVADKQTIKNLLAEQYRFAKLYHTPPSLRLTAQNWVPPVFTAVKNLLVAFYAPLFYQNEGFPNADGTVFHKEHFLDPSPKICPYTDGTIQDTKLDHFLPKDQFPLLSCHPDNLVPCGTDSNSGGHKGTKVPLDLPSADQAAAWFHPRWRSAKGTYRLTFISASGAPQPQVQFVALNSTNQPRLNNLESMFGLSDFWGRYLDDEVQSVASEVSGWLRFNGTPATEANIKSHVLICAKQKRDRIGRDALAIVQSFYYEHIAQTPVLLAQVVRTCTQGT